MKKSSASSGFTLVEIAIVLTIIGILLGSGIIALNGIMADIRYRTTQDRLRGISHALAVYAQQRFSLPCPANPAVLPVTGLTSGTSCNTYAPGANSAIGIVPYATLGLTQEQVRDSYGNFITYAVNQNLAGTTPQANNNVQNACRVNGIWFDSAANKYPRKARFCCISLPVGQDLLVHDGSGNTISPQRVAGTAGAITSGVAETSVTTYETQAAAFVLTSHGKNGFGAFQVNGTNARLSGNNTGRPSELGNENNDNIFIAALRSSNNTSYFDDILFWQSQDQLISAFGRDSCARP